MSPLVCPWGIEWADISIIDLKQDQCKWVAELFRGNLRPVRDPLGRVDHGADGIFYLDTDGHRVLDLVAIPPKHLGRRAPRVGHGSELPVRFEAHRVGDQDDRSSGHDAPCRTFPRASSRSECLSAHALQVGTASKTGCSTTPLAGRVQRAYHWQVMVFTAGFLPRFD
jgi:hypothetical protein